MVLDPGRTIVINETVHFRRRIAIQLKQSQDYADKTFEATLKSVALNGLRVLCAGTTGIAIFA